MTAITIPKRRTGRQSAAAIERYNRDLGEFLHGIGADTWAPTLFTVPSS